MTTPANNSYRKPFFDIISKVQEKKGGEGPGPSGVTNKDKILQDGGIKPQNAAHSVGTTTRQPSSNTQGTVRKFPAPTATPSPLLLEFGRFHAQPKINTTTEKIVAAGDVSTNRDFAKELASIRAGRRGKDEYDIPKPTTQPTAKAESEEKQVKIEIEKKAEPKKKKTDEELFKDTIIQYKEKLKDEKSDPIQVANAFQKILDRADQKLLSKKVIKDELKSFKENFLNLETLLRNQNFHDKFAHHLVREFSTENLEFYDAALDYEKKPTPEKFKKTVETFINRNGSKWINLPYVISQNLLIEIKVEMQKLKEGKDGNLVLNQNNQLNSNLFSKAKDNIKGLMGADSFARFQNTQPCQMIMNKYTFLKGKLID